MADYSLTPVDHQPDFEPEPPQGISFQPVDHAPYFNEADAAAMSPETFANPAVKGMIQGIAHLVTAPGNLMAQNPYPAGSEEASWYEDQRNKGMGDWAAGAALATMGTGAVAGVPLRAGEMALGAAAVRGVKSAMPEISSLQELKNAIAANGNDPLFVRYSQGPQFDMRLGAVSKDYQTGEIHNGLSAVELNSGMDDAELVRYIRDYASGGEPHVYSGKVNGLDSDGGPTIRPSEHIGKLSRELTDMIGDESVPNRLELQKMIEQYNSVLDRLTPFQHQRLQEMRTSLDAMGGPVNHPGLGHNFSLNLNY